MPVSLGVKGPADRSWSMLQVTCKPSELDEPTRAFYCRTLRVLRAGGIGHLVGGAYALERYTGIERHTKDLDVFVRRRDCADALTVLATAGGCQCELTHPHWLAKVHCGERFVDVIFSSGNGIAEVDEQWFAHARRAEVLGEPTLLCPPEEIIWSKAFIMERERYDGADVAHLLRACGRSLDWTRLLERFGAEWPVLVSHLVLFDYIYPGERAQIPAQVRRELWRRQARLARAPAALGSDTVRPLCRGTLLSRAQYLIDVEEWGYGDARLSPPSHMTREQVAHWTAAIENEEPHG